MRGGRRKQLAREIRAGEWLGAIKKMTMRRRARARKRELGVVKRVEEEGREKRNLQRLRRIRAKVRIMRKVAKLEGKKIPKGKLTSKARNRIPLVRVDKKAGEKVIEIFCSKAPGKSSAIERKK